MASTDEQFETLLGSYRSNYMQYVVTGEPAYQKAYQTAYNQIEQLITARQEQVNAEKSSATSFLSNFKKDNESIQSMRDRAQSMIGELQQTKNQYEAAKTRYDNTDVLSSINPQNQIGLGIVLRFGILMLLIPIFFVLGYFYPAGEGLQGVQLQQAREQLGTTADVLRAVAQSPAFGARTASFR
jgi:hypothetical protein